MELLLIFKAEIEDSGEYKMLLKKEVGKLIKRSIYIADTTSNINTPLFS